MPRIRSLKPEFWTDEKLAPLDPTTRLVFLGLISHADDAGRLVDSVKLLDGLIFPATDDSCREALDTLARLSRVSRYASASGQALIQITNWTKHQKVDHPSAYNLPAQSKTAKADKPATDAVLATPSRESRETLAPRSSIIDHLSSINDLKNRSELHPNIVEPGGSTLEVIESPDLESGEDGKHGPVNGAVVVRNGRPATVEQAKQRGIAILSEVVAENASRVQREVRREGMIDFVFAYWAAKTGHANAKLDTKRVIRLRRRFEENDDDVNELCFTVDGLFKDRALMGENDRNRKYDQIETIFRDRGMVEALSELAGYKPGKVHPIVRKYTNGETHG